MVQVLVTPRVTVYMVQVVVVVVAQTARMAAEKAEIGGFIFTVEGSHTLMPEVERTTVVVRRVQEATALTGYSGAAKVVVVVVTTPPMATAARAEMAESLEAEVVAAEPLLTTEVAPGEQAA